MDNLDQILPAGADRRAISSSPSLTAQHEQQHAAIPLSLLCARCREVLSHPISSLFDGPHIDFDIDDFSETSKYCHLCAVLSTHSLVQAKTEAWSLCYDQESKMFTLYSHRFGHGGRDSASTMLSFLPATIKDGLPAVTLHREYHRFPLSVVSICPDLTDRCTSDEDSFKQIRRWLHECQKNHKLCSTGCAKSSFLPTRLIDISEHPRLIETGEMECGTQNTRYATLSHRWLPDSTTKLLRSNLGVCKQAIASHLLSRIFSDSIVAARRLGLNYIWIDALCIVQDDTEDWRRESSLMGLVYTNAFCNFGASYANQGLFHSRLRSELPVVHVNICWEGDAKPYYGFPYVVHADLDDVPLLQRGWVLQERLLSPRSIYFGTQLTWECLQLLASQIFPQGSPSFRGFNPQSTNSPVRLQNLVLQRKVEVLE